MNIIKKGKAMGVNFWQGVPFDPDFILSIMDAEVTLYDTGLVHIDTGVEEITLSIHNCEIVWKYDLSSLHDTPPKNNIKLLRPGKEDKSEE